MELLKGSPSLHRECGVQKIVEPCLAYFSLRTGYGGFIFPESMVSSVFQLFPTLGVGLLDPNLYSSPRPGTLLLARSTPRSSLECLAPECPWSAQPQSVPPGPRVSLECPTPEYREGGDVRSKLVWLAGAAQGSHSLQASGFSGKVLTILTRLKV